MTLAIKVFLTALIVCYISSGWIYVTPDEIISLCLAVFATFTAGILTCLIWTRGHRA